MSVKKREPCIIFGRSEKLENDMSTRRIVPGPGQYSYQSRERKGVIIGKSLRQSFSD